MIKIGGAARLLIFLLSAGIAGTSNDSANAGSRAKNVVPALMTFNTHTLTRNAPASFRFFTINQVLSTHGRNSRGSYTVRLAATHSSKTMTDAFSTSPVNPEASDEPFGLHSFRAPEGLLWAKWLKVESEIRADMQALVDCRADSKNCRSRAVRSFKAIVDEARPMQGRAKIETVNRSINAAIRYTSDQIQHGVPDLWSGPLATFKSVRGDCEDYAVAKYVALREAGVSPVDLRLLFGRDRLSGQDHAVLGVRNLGRWLILDNRHLAVLEPSKIPHFVPLFAASHLGVILFAAPYIASVACVERCDKIEPHTPVATTY